MKISCLSVINREIGSIKRELSKFEKKVKYITSYCLESLYCLTHSKQIADPKHQGNWNQHIVEICAKGNLGALDAVSRWQTTFNNTILGNINGQTKSALEASISSGNLKVIQRVIQKSEDINETTEVDAPTPLMIACEIKDQEARQAVVKFILDKEGNPTLKITNGQNALSVAIKNNDTKTLLQLLPKVKPEDLASTDVIRQVFRTNNTDVILKLVDLILKKSPSKEEATNLIEIAYEEIKDEGVRQKVIIPILDKADKKVILPLMCRKNDQNCLIKALTGATESDLDTVYERGSTVEDDRTICDFIYEKMINEIEYGDPCIKANNLLIDKMAARSIVDDAPTRLLFTLSCAKEQHTVSEFENTVKRHLRLIIESRKKSCLKELIKFIKEDLVLRNLDLEYQGVPFLHSAIESGHIDLIPSLIELGCKLSDKTAGGLSIVHTVVLSSKCNFVEVMNALMEQDPSLDINQQDNMGNTPLHWAVKDQKEETIRWLSLKGAKNIQNLQGKFPDDMLPEKNEGSFAPMVGNLVNSTKEALTAFAAENLGISTKTAVESATGALNSALRFVAGWA